MFENKSSNSPQIRVTEYKKPETLTSGIPVRQESPRVSRRWVWVVSIVAAIIVLGALGLYIRSQQQLEEVKKNLESAQNDPAAKAKEDSKELLDQVGKLIILPNDEQPTIATVSDLSKLENQPFFAKAQVGDKVLIYQVAKKAILYRPSSNQIIELAPLNNNGQTSPATSSPEQAPAASAPATSEPPAAAPVATTPPSQ